MAAMTLEYDDLIKATAHFLGWGRTAYASLATARQELCDNYVQAGYQLFLYPINGYEWSFFKPTTTIAAWGTTTTAAVTVGGTGNKTLTVAADTFHPSMVGHSIVADTSETSYTIDGYADARNIIVTVDASADTGDTFTITADGNYRLPDDFAGMEGPLTYPVGNGFAPISIGNEHGIRRRRMTSYTGQPVLAALAPVTHDPTVGQRYDLQLYPTPGSDYTLTYVTNVIPDKLSTTNKYPLGGPLHAQTLIEACLAIAEERSDDEDTGHRARFNNLLAASIRKDAVAHGPETLGYNRNDSYGRSARLIRPGNVTVYDVQY